ncbi:MAG: thioredoxin [Candidatus Sumerlaeia bacterium]
MASDKVINLTDSDFDKAVGAGQPILIDFWAEWCGPCKRMVPVVEDLADTYAGRLTVAKVNIDEHQAAATRLGIQSIPTLVIYKNGQLAERIVGQVPRDTVVEAIERVLA